MYVMQVKKPSELKYPWDYYSVVQTMSGDQAFGRLSNSACPLVKTNTRAVAHPELAEIDGLSARQAERRPLL